MSDAANSSATAGSGPPPLVESPRDEQPTHMTYGQGTRLPWYVIAVWLIAMTSLGAYFLIHYLPDLQKWGAP